MPIALNLATKTSTNIRRRRRRKKRCMLLLMLLSRLSYLLLFIRFPSTAYQECRRSNTLHNEDIRANLFSSSSLLLLLRRWLLYREICILLHNSVVDSECEEEKKKGGNDFSLFLSSSVGCYLLFLSLSFVYLTVRSCLFSLP